MVDLSQYVFEALRKDDKFVLYRGRSKGDGSGILVVSPVTEYPPPQILQWQEHAYSLREELDPAWAARPIAIARHWDRTVLVLEDPGGEPLDQLLGPPATLPRRRMRAGSRWTWGFSCVSQLAFPEQ